MTEMIQLNTIPEYLKKGKLYNNFDDDDELIPVKLQYYKEDTYINSIDELYHLFHTLRYWLVEEKDYPYKDIFDFVRNNKNLDYKSFYETFHNIRFINQIKMILKEDFINLCGKASKNGYLLLLQYAHENSCVFSISVCENASKNGHFDCLKYARENGCPE